MATVNLGRVGLVLKGEYDASTKYEKLDVVTYQGSSYIAKQATTGNAPTNESFWQLQSEKGEKGDKGDAGGGLTRLDDQTPVTVEGVLAGKNGKLAPADFVPAEILPTNTAAQAGIVTAPTANNSNSLWSTDGSGNPAWRYYDYQTKAQIQQLIATAIFESGHASFEKIDHIPTVEEAKDNILYLVYNTKTEHYDIYAKVVNEKGTPEVLLIDDTTVDLSDYVTNEALAAKDYATNTALQAATTEINTNLNNKVDKEAGKGLSSNDYTADDKSKLAGIEASADVNKIESVKLNGTALPIDEKAVNIDLSAYDTKANVTAQLATKVDKESGKKLSTEDYSTADKQKLSGIATGAEVNRIDTVKVNNIALPITQKAVNIDLSDYATDSELSTGLSGKVDKQEGKQLSTEDFTTAYKNKLDGIPEGGGGGEVNIINTVKVNGTALVPDAEKAVNVKVDNETFQGVLPIDKGGTGNQIGQALSLPGWQIKKITVEELNDPELFTGGVYSVEKGELIPGAGTAYYVIRLSGHSYGYYYRDIALPYDYNTQRANNAIYTRFWSNRIPGEWHRIPTVSELPTNTSQLINDSGFITSNDIPEGAAASNTVPKAPAATGSVGNELAFARGDHVHPIGTVPVDNFSGILPVEKGGTNSQGLFSDKIPFPLTNFRTAFGQPLVSSFMTPVRVQGSDAWDSYSSGLAFGAGDTNGYICINYNDYYPAVIVGGGDNENITWYKRLAFSDQIPTIATSSKPGLIKPGTGCEVTSDGTLNVTAIGEIPGNPDNIMCQTLTVNDLLTAHYGAIDELEIGDSITCDNITCNNTLSALIISAQTIQSDSIPTTTSQLENDSRFVTEDNLPIASSDTLGVIKVGSGLSISNGTLSTQTSNLYRHNITFTVGSEKNTVYCTVYDKYSSVHDNTSFIENHLGDSYHECVIGVSDGYKIAASDPQCQMTFGRFFAENNYGNLTFRYYIAGQNWGQTTDVVVSSDEVVEL